MRISKIISGGQTGADRGGLDSAIYMGIPYGGHVPKGRISEDGVVPDCYKNMVEHDDSNYVARTALNVKNADVTLIFCHGEPTGGSKRTVEIALRDREKKMIVIDLDNNFEQEVSRVSKFLLGLNDNLTVNVAGSRESKAKGIQKEVCQFMMSVVANVNKE